LTIPLYTPRRLWFSPHMEPSIQPNEPRDEFTESPVNPLLALMVDICHGHCEMTLAQIQASLPANPPVPVYATRTIVNRIDCK
jgi:hypothetical protein